MKNYLTALLLISSFATASAQSPSASIDSTKYGAVLLDIGMINELPGRSGVDVFGLAVTHEIPIIVDYIHASKGKIVMSSTSGFMSYSESSVPESERSALTLSTGWSYKAGPVLLLTTAGVSYESIAQRTALNEYSTTTGWLFMTTTYHADVATSSYTDVAFTPSLGLLFRFSKVFGMSALYGACRRAEARSRICVLAFRSGCSRKHS